MFRHSISLPIDRCLTSSLSLATFLSSFVCLRWIKRFSVVIQQLYGFHSRNIPKTSRNTYISFLLLKIYRRRLCNFRSETESGRFLQNPSWCVCFRELARWAHADRNWLHSRIDSFAQTGESESVKHCTYFLLISDDYFQVSRMLQFRVDEYAREREAIPYVELVHIGPIVRDFTNHCCVTL